jgi:hypothetical protein
VRPHVYTCPRKSTTTFSKNPHKSKKKWASFVDPTYYLEPILFNSITE